MSSFIKSAAISFGAVTLAGCGSIDCMSVPTYSVGNVQYYRQIDASACAASRAEKESQAYYEGRAKEQARNGSSYDKYALGADYESGGTVSINEDGRWRGMTATLNKSRRQAIYWYKEAIKQGGSGADKAREALIRLGKKPPETPAAQLSVLGYEAHEKGNDVQAAKYWLEAAQKGDSVAQNNIGWAYDTGRGVKQNYPEAVRWYRRAAEQGNQRAQGSLAEIYLFGLPGIAIDMAEAYKFTRLAAEQGDQRSQKNLGMMYLKGDPVPQSDADAVKWFRIAADSGYAPAQFSMGSVYENGSGVPKNLNTAIEWYRRSAANGEERATQALQRLGAGS